MNVFIVGGAGTIGSATAAWLALRDVVDEVVIFDQNTDMAESHVMDLAQAVFISSKCKVSVGKWEDLKRCGIVVVAAGLPAAVATHDACKDLNSLMPLIQAVADNLNRYRPDAVVLSMTNPLDAFNYLLYKVSGLPAKQFIALSRNDTLRFQWALGELWSISPDQTGGFVVGEHGPGKIPLFSTVRKAGAPIALDPDEQEKVRQSMQTFWGHFLQVSGPRTAGWTSGAAAGQVVEAILGQKKEAICCSVIAQEEQGYSFGWPVFLDSTGVTNLLKLNLTETEQKAVAEGREKIKALTAQVLNYVGLAQSQNA